MNSGSISPEIQKFVADHIVSADQLDILLLLHSRAGEALTARSVSQAVFTVPTAATMRLEQLVSGGLAVSSGGTDPAYSYRPASPAMGQTVDALAAAYRANRVAVIQLVFQKPADPLKTFADAFRLKKEK